MLTNVNTGEPITHQRIQEARRRARGKDAARGTMVSAIDGEAACIADRDQAEHFISSLGRNTCAYCARHRDDHLTAAERKRGIQRRAA